MAEKVDNTVLQTALVGAVTSVFSNVKKEKKRQSTFSDTDDEPDDDFVPKRPSGKKISRQSLPSSSRFLISLGFIIIIIIINFYRL